MVGNRYLHSTEVKNKYTNKKVQKYYLHTYIKPMFSKQDLAFLSTILQKLIVMRDLKKFSKCTLKTASWSLSLKLGLFGTLKLVTIILVYKQFVLLLSQAYFSVMSAKIISKSASFAEVID